LTRSPPRAGAVAIAKCVALPNLGAGDSCKSTTTKNPCAAYADSTKKKDNEVELFNWDITESTVTMIAACIPTLRMLFREARHTTPQAYKLSHMSYKISRGGVESKGTRIADEATLGGSQVRWLRVEVVEDKA